MLRRRFLEIAGAGSCVPLCCPDVFLWPEEPKLTGTNPEGAKPARPERILVLIELSGGNDGLNTVVPWRDERYYELRRDLALERGAVIPLADARDGAAESALALHPALRPLVEAWEAEELAIALGVGYDAPNRSHFRSIEIWDTASRSDEYLRDGWVARAFAGAPPPTGAAADGIVIGRGSAAPLTGGDFRSILLDDPERFTRQAGRIRDLAAPTDNPALAHLLEVRAELRAAAAQIEEKCRTPVELGAKFPAGRLGQQMEIAARLIASRLPVAVLKVTHGGFDTHVNQAGPHERLLRELAESIAALRAAMKKCGLWERVAVMTYSEFGRRAAQNGNRGTDHGTAAPHFLLGGRVRGGLHGRQPSLVDLGAGGDLKHTLQFQALYATIARDWWGLAPAAGDPFAGVETLPLIRKEEKS